MLKRKRQGHRKEGARRRRARCSVELLNVLKRKAKQQLSNEHCVLKLRRPGAYVKELPTADYELWRTCF